MSITPHRIVSYHTIPYYFIPYHPLSYHTISHRIIPYHRLTNDISNKMWQVDTLIQLSYLAGCSIKFPSNYSEHFTSSCPLLVNDNPIPENEKFCTQVVKHTSNVVTKGYHQRHNAQDDKAAQRQHQHEHEHE